MSDRGPDTGVARPNLWRPLATVAVFSILPFAVFLNDNRDETTLDLSLVLYTLFLLVPGFIAVWAVGRWRGPRARERAAVVFAIASFLFFQFQLVREGVEIFASPASDLAVFVAWVAVFALAIWLAVRLSRSPLAWNYALVAGALLLALPVAQYAYSQVTEPEADDAAEVAGGPSFKGERPADRPNVYFFLLDGYGRADQLQKLGIQNEEFLGDLEKRGFEVEDSALASYPTTFLSLTSTLQMDYVVEEGDLGDHSRFYFAMRGDNAAVSAFHDLGYRAVHATDWQALACQEQIDICLRPEKESIEGFGGEREQALLEATPLTTVLPQLDIHVHSLSGYFTPNQIVRKVQAEDERHPRFVLGHVVAPHPPFRFAEGCELRDAHELGTLEDWGDPDSAGPVEYGRAVRCVNRDMLAAIDRIRESDPGAIVVVAGDHGPRFGYDFQRPASEWTEPQLAERFSILYARSLPERCETSSPKASAAINTFRIILACITGREPELLEPRHFVPDLEANETTEIEPDELP